MAYTRTNIRKIISFAYMKIMMKVSMTASLFVVAHWSLFEYICIFVCLCILMYANTTRMRLVVASL